MGILSRKKEYDYFGNFLCCAKSGVEAACYLQEAFQNFDVEKVPMHVERMHKIENDADMEKHEMIRNLAQEFITPIEREDIAALSQELDNIVDAIEDVMRRIYMFNVKSLRPEALEFSALIVDCCQAFEKLVEDFRCFKKSKTINEHIITVNTVENRGDRLHADSLRRLFTEESSTDEKLVWTTIFEALEACLDACENAADIIEGVVMKNT